MFCHSWTTVWRSSGTVGSGGGRCANHQTDLVTWVTSLQHQDEIMRNHIMPFVQNHGPGILLQHVLMFPESVQNELQVRNIDTLPWPAISPYLSICYQLNMCHQLNMSGTSRKRRLQQQLHPPQTVQDLCKRNIRDIDMKSTQLSARE